MIRKVLATLLILASAGSVYLLRQTSAPRGVKFTVFDEPGWAGEVVQTVRSRHLDHGNTLRRNKLALQDNSSLRATGWLYVPRRGNYEFEVESDDDNWLYLDETLVSSNRGGRKPKARARELSRGFHSFRLDTHHKSGGYTTLVRWKMPAGYMELESIPPFFLRPDSPSSSPLPWIYRLIPLCLFLAAVLVALAPWISRRWQRLRRESAYRRHLFIGLLLFSLALGVRNIDLNGAGETCDEWAYGMAGQIYVSNSAHGYFQSTYWNSNDEHPPVGKYLYGLASHLAGSDDFGVLRFTSTLMNALTVLLTFFIGLRLFSLPVAIMSALVLALLPHFIAHGKVAGLDSPSVLLYTLTVGLFLRATFQQKVSNTAYLVASIAGCLAFATKFSNATVFIFMIAVYLYREWPDLRTRGAMRLPVSLYLLPVLPFVILFLIWPWLWREPFGQFVKTLSHWNYPIAEWFLDDYRKPPVYYYPVYLLATIPAGLLLPLSLFFFRRTQGRINVHRLIEDVPAPTENHATVANDTRHAERLQSPQGRRVIVLFWFLSALLWSFSSFKQDGVRYIYTAFPAIALMCGVGTAALIRKAQWWPAAWFGTAAYMVWQLSYVHPYYLDYYNELVGGTKTVWEHRLLEVGWWGEGIPEAVDHVNRVSHYGATWSQRGIVTHTTHGLRDDLIEVDKNPDYLIWSNIRPEEVQLVGYDIDYEVKVDGAPIAIVFIKESTLKEMRLGLDPTDSTNVPYGELGTDTKRRATEQRAAQKPTMPSPPVRNSQSP